MMAKGGTVANGNRGPIEPPKWAATSSRALFEFSIGL
jgi:hypothetical protein